MSLADVITVDNDDNTETDKELLNVLKYINYSTNTRAHHSSAHAANQQQDEGNDNIDDDLQRHKTPFEKV